MAKKAYTIRIDAKVLERVQVCAKLSNRSVNNFVETVLSEVTAGVDDEDEDDDEHSPENIDSVKSITDATRT